ncbi:MAG: hypothetical protein ACPGJV_06525 [Bacteriovoracaceae bacterium]
MKKFLILTLILSCFSLVAQDKKQVEEVKKLSLDETVITVGEKLLEIQSLVDAQKINSRSNGIYINELDALTDSLGESTSRLEELVQKIYNENERQKRSKKGLKLTDPSMEEAGKAGVRLMLILKALSGN